MIQVILVAGSIIEEGGRFLLVQENMPGHPQYHKKWNIPSGRVDEGEDVIAAAKRETEEETGLDVEPLRLIRVYESSLVMGGSVECHIFEARIVGGELTVPDDMLDVRGFSLDEIRELEKKGLLMFSYVLQAIEDRIANR